MRTVAQLLAGPIVAPVAALLTEADVPAWLVGGYVRDRLIGRPTNDVDFVIDGDAMAWARRIADEFGGAFVPLDADRGVGRAVIQQPDGTRYYVDVSRLRGPSIEADLQLRDFTVNALAVAVDDARLIDTSGGYQDLNRFWIRAVADRAFRDDPLRLLRAIRLAASLQFTIVPATLELIRRDANRLTEPAPERIRMELMKLLAQELVAPALALLDELSLLEHVFPELVDCQGVEQPVQHTLDVYGHTLKVVSALEQLFPWHTDVGDTVAQHFWQPPLDRHRDAMSAYLREDVAFHQPRWLLLKLTALLHDVGKPATRSVDEDGDIHFYEHERVGADLVRRRLRALRFPEQSVAWVTTVIRHHLRPMYLSSAPKVTRRALYRVFRDTDDIAMALALHSAADQLGKGETEIQPALRAVVDRIWQAGFAPERNVVAPRPLLDGNDLQGLGIPPGPKLGQILELLKEQQAAGAANTREEAERYVLEVWQKMQT